MSESDAWRSTLDVTDCDPDIDPLIFAAGEEQSKTDRPAAFCLMERPESPRYHKPRIFPLPVLLPPFRFHLSKYL